MVAQRFLSRHTCSFILPTLFVGYLSHGQAAEQQEAMPFSELSAEMSGQRLDVSHTLSTETGAITDSIHLPNAEFIKIHFDRIQLEQGDRIELSSNTGEQQIITHQDTKNEQDDLWALSMRGDKITIEIHQQKRNAALGLSASLSIDSVQRGMSENDQPLFDEPVEESICGNSDLKSLSCHNADPSITQAAQAVAQLSFPCETDGSGGLCDCTAWRVGPRGDTMMTNNHCISNAAQISGSEVFFNFQSNQCGGGAEQNKVGVRVDRILMTNYDLDVTVFTVKNPERIAQFGSLSIETQPVQANHEIFIPQHPAGRAKEIALFSDMDGGNCRIGQVGVNGRANGTDLTYFCDTEGGSSGSPVISRQTGKVVGLHHFGGCDNAGVRMDRIATAVQPYLGSNSSTRPVSNTATPSASTPSRPTSTPTFQPTPTTQESDDMGIEYINDRIGIVYHKDHYGSVTYNFLCVNDDCQPATRRNGRFERVVKVAPNETVDLEFIIESRGQQCMTGRVSTYYNRQGVNISSSCL